MKFWRKPLDADQITQPRGRVHIIINRCKGCGFCIKYCPKQVLEFSGEFNRKGYHPPLVVRPADCVDCGLCEVLCPEFAIWVTPVEAALREDPPREEGVEPAYAEEESERAG